MISHTVYETKDGEKFSDKEKALKHEEIVDLKNEFAKLLEEAGPDYFNENVNVYHENDIVEFMARESERLYDIIIRNRERKGIQYEDEDTAEARDEDLIPSEEMELFVDAIFEAIHNKYRKLDKKGQEVPKEDQDDEEEIKVLKTKIFNKLCDTIRIEIGDNQYQVWQPAITGTLQIVIDALEDIFPFDCSCV